MIKSIRRKIRWTLLCFAIVFNGWMIYSFQSANLPEDTFVRTARLSVTETDDFITYQPVNASQVTVMFYPGALVDPKAYAPLCRRIAEYGYTVMIIKMPWRMANLGYKIPLEKGMLSDTTRQFVLIGHSKGAAMVARFIYEYPQHINKAILVATTHPKEQDLSHLKIPIMKIIASNDWIADERSIIDNKRLLPDLTRYVRIPGGNHAQFAHYGRQFMDGKASITREQQQEIALESILSFLK